MLAAHLGFQSVGNISHELFRVAIGRPRDGLESANAKSKIFGHAATFDCFDDGAFYLLAKQSKWRVFI